MFWHIFIHRLKCLTRDRQLLFWSFLFPLMLSSLFSLAFSNLAADEVFNEIPIAVVSNEAYQNNKTFADVLTSVSTGSSDSKRLFLTTECSEAQAADSLNNNKISGYVLLETDGNIHVIVKDSGINQTILKEFVDSYLQTSSAYKTILQQNPMAMQSLSADSEDEPNYLKEVAPGAAAPDNTIVYYYALIAMACMYGGFWGMKEVSAVQANQSSEGARVNLAPVHKLKVFGYSLCAATVIHVTSILILIAYMRVVLNIQFGSQLGYILLASVAGCFAGVSFGAMLGAVLKKSDGIKTAILIASSMIFSFLSGLMVMQMKYIVATSAPILSYINPASLISDAFYSLYYYTTHTRYFMNIGLLFAFSALLYLIVYFVMRRQKYASL